jgi:hypothetical protein
MEHRHITDYTMNNVERRERLQMQRNRRFKNFLTCLSNFVTLRFGEVIDPRQHVLTMLLFVRFHLIFGVHTKIKRSNFEQNFVST